MNDLPEDFEPVKKKEAKTDLPPDFEPMKMHGGSWIPANKDMTEVAQDIAIPAIQGLTRNWGDEAWGALSAGAKKLAGSKENFMELLQKEAKPMRDMYSESVDRSPKTALVSEIAGSMASPGKFAGIPGALTEGAISGMGATEGKDTSGTLLDTGISSAVSAVPTVIGKVFKSAVKMTPNQVRAKILGAGGKEFGESGIKNREKVTKELHEKGLFSGKPIEYNTQVNKFVPVKEGYKKGQMSLPTSNRLLDRINDAKSKLASETDTIIKRNNKPVNFQALEAKLDLAVHEFADSIPGKYSDSAQKAMEFKDELLKELKASSTGNKTFSLEDLNNKKKDLYNYVGNYGKVSAETPDAEMMYQSFARNTKDFLNDAIPDKKFQELNNTYSKFATSGKDLEKKVNKIMGAGSGAEGKIDPYRMAEKGIFKGMGGEDTQLAIQTGKEAWQNAPIPFKPKLERGASDIMTKGPGVLTRQQLINREPNSVQPEQEQTQVNPHSRPTSAIQAPIMKQIMQNPLPRSSGDWLQNKPWIMKKFEVMHPESAPMLAQAFAKPDTLDQFMRMWSQTMPSEFETDKLNRIDGKFSDQQSEEMAVKDIMDNDDLSNTQKALMVQSVRKTKTLKDYNITT